MIEYNPFTTSIPHKIIGTMLLFILWIVPACLFIFYENMPVPAAFIQSLAVPVIWGILFYYSWYLLQFIRIWTAWAVLIVAIQCISLVSFYTVWYLTGLINLDVFLLRMPVLLLCGTLSWIVVMQWYSLYKEKSNQMLPALSEMEIKREEKKEAIDRISVKNGTRIHIIPIEKILYIQACGDYVNLFAVEGQFIKEQTMKSLEDILPDTFVRIHRSTILNTDYILRIELFGKESYHVRLTDDTTLKASIAGYRLLKQRLSL